MLLPLLQATKPRIPEENLEVLARIAAKDRDMLHTIGATPEVRRLRLT